MTVTLLKRLATLAALVCLAATLNTSAVGAQESRPGTQAALAGDQTPELQINRLYSAVFARDPDAGGFAFWVNELTSGARNLQQIADAMVSVSPEFTDTYGNLDNAGFVNQLYLNVQDRPGEASGIAFWAGQLDSGALTRGGVVLGFSESLEYRKATGSADPLDRLYCAFFLRNPDSGGKAFWTDQYLVEERSLDSIAQSFSAVPEFSNLYGSLSDRQFVNLIYRNVLGRNLPLTEIAGPDFWTNELATGARTRGQVMIGFSEAPEYQNRWTANAPCPGAGTATVTAVNDSASVAVGSSTVVNWANNDVRPSGTTVAIATQPANGAAVSNANNTFTYTPTANTTATSDSFTYTLTNGGTTSTATVNISILPVGTDTAAEDDRFFIKADTPFALTVLDNDVTTGRTLGLPSTTSPEGGTLSIVGQTIMYTPAAGYILGRDALGVLDPDTFTYTLTETATGNVSTAMVEVAVLDGPNCEVFMNYPFGSTNGVGGDDTTMELFFSSESCNAVYDQTNTAVAWNGVTINGTPVATTDGINILQEFVTITPSTNPVTVEGTAVLTVGGTVAVTIEFRLEFTTPDGGATWTRTVSTYKGRNADVTVNPAVPTCIDDNSCNS